MAHVTRRALRDHWCRSLAPLAATLLLAGIASPVNADADAWNPNLTLRIADDELIHADADNPFQIVVNNYQSASMPGLHVDNLLIDLRLDDATGMPGIILASTSSTTVGGHHEPANFWYEQPDENAPSSIGFDVVVTLDTAGRFPEETAPYDTVTHLLGTLMAVEGGGSGAVDVEGELSDAFVGFRGYGVGRAEDMDGIGVADDAELDEILLGEIDHAYASDFAGLAYTYLIAPPDVHNTVAMGLSQLKTVLSHELGDRNGMFYEVSATQSVTLVPEPGAAALLVGLGLAVMLRRRGRHG